MVEEFDANLIGVGVVAESTAPSGRAVKDYTSLMRVDAENNAVVSQAGNYLEKIFN